MVVGKGSMRPVDGSNPDYDNEASTDWGTDHLIIDNASYKALIDPNSCGDPGTIYFEADEDQDCYVTLKDFATFIGQWMWCTDPERSECDIYW
jgi:hypothetical protein